MAKSGQERSAKAAQKRIEYDEKDYDPMCESSSSMIRSAFSAAVVANS